jgi:hypothetical protein
VSQLVGDPCKKSVAQKAVIGQGQSDPERQIGNIAVSENFLENITFQPSEGGCQRLTGFGGGVFPVERQLTQEEEAIEPPTVDSFKLDVIGMPDFQFELSTLGGLPRVTASEWNSVVEKNIRKISGASRHIRYMDGEVAPIVTRADKNWYVLGVPILKEKNEAGNAVFRLALSRPEGKNYARRTQAALIWLVALNRAGILKKLSDTTFFKQESSRSSQGRNTSEGKKQGKKPAQVNVEKKNLRKYEKDQRRNAPASLQNTFGYALWVKFDLDGRTFFESTDLAAARALDFEQERALRLLSMGRRPAQSGPRRS